MRGDVLALDVDDVVWLLKLISLTESLARRAHLPLPPVVADRKSDLAEWLAGRVDGRADATTRPPDDGPVDAEVMTAADVATALGLTAGAVAKRCRTGSFAAVSRKVGGVWIIPSYVVDDVNGGTA